MSRNKSSIRRRIREKQAQARQCERLLQQTHAELRKQEQTIEVWQRMLSTLESEEITGQVVVKTLLEGGRSEFLRDQFLDSRAVKTEKELWIRGLTEEEEQLAANIQRRIWELEEEIQDLYDQLHDDDD